MSFRIIQSIQYFVIARLVNYTPILTNGLVFGYRLINLKLLKVTPSSFTAIGDSGKETHRLFCGDCATPIGLKCDGFDLYSLSASTIKGGKALRPKMLIYTSVAPDWATFPKGIPKYDTLPPSG